jgi:hypothetical protein
MNTIESLKTPHINTVINPEITRHIKELTPSGKLAVTQNNLTYLKLDDNYIHELFPLITQPGIQKPDYFNPGSEGAHMTVIYPEENKTIKAEDLNQQHEFTINQIATAEIINKIDLRHRYQLPDLLGFRGYAIGFHITIGFEMIN